MFLGCTDLPVQEAEKDYSMKLNFDENQISNKIYEANANTVSHIITH